MIVLAAVGLLGSVIVGLLTLVFSMGMRIVAMTIATTLSIFLVLWFLAR